MYQSLSYIFLITALLLCGSVHDATAQQRKNARTEQASSSGKKTKTGTQASSQRKAAANSTRKKTTSKSSAPRTADEIKRAKERTQGDIREAQRKIQLNTRETERRLNQLNLLEGEIEQCNTRIGSLTARVDSLNSHITVAGDSIAALDRRLAAITERYIKSLRKTQGHGQQMSDLAFIFSSESFAQAYRRMRSLRQFSKWRKRRSQEISGMREELDRRREELTRMRGNVTSSLTSLNNERATLVKKQGETGSLVERLRREGGELKQIMARRQQEAASLDAELDRIIAEEARRQEQLRREREEAERKAREAAEAKARAEEEAARQAAEKAEAERIAQAEARAEAEARKKAQAKAEAEKQAAMQNARDEAERERIRQKAEEKAAKEAEEQVKKEREAARKAEQKKIKEEREAEKKRLEAEKKAAREKAKNGKPVKHKGRNNGRGDVGVPETSPTPAGTAPVLTAPTGGTSGVAPTVSLPTGDDFGKYRGRLPFPVTGHYTIVKRFGRQKHPTLPHVETTNSGIDMATAAGAAVRCVFDGEVSAVFRPDGYNNVVVIRHGRYMTVYANLGTISVSTGQKIKAGETIGTVYSDPADANRSILHFEIRNQRQKENPEEWLKR